MKNLTELLTAIRELDVDWESTIGSESYIARSRVLLPLCAKVIEVLSNYTDGRMDSHDVFDCDDKISKLLEESE